MKSSDLVPGIQAYPDLAASLQQAVARQPGCGNCGYAKLAADFRERLRRRLERDKWLKTR